MADSVAKTGSRVWVLLGHQLDQGSPSQSKRNGDMACDPSTNSSLASKDHDRRNILLTVEEKETVGLGWWRGTVPQQTYRAGALAQLENALHRGVSCKIQQLQSVGCLAIFEVLRLLIPTVNLDGLICLPSFTNTAHH